MAATATGFVQAVRKEIGVPYEWGGESPKGFDCSGLVAYALTRLGVADVPRTSEEQWRWVQRVPFPQVQPGDLVFLNFPGEQSPGHVAVYSKPGYVVQAPAPGQSVQEVPFTPQAPGTSEWGGTVVGYGRVPGLAYAAVRSAGGRALPPRPGNPNNPGGAADPGKEAGDAASDAWKEYADELHPSDTAAMTEFASLNLFGWNVPGTSWVPSFLSPGSIIPGVPDLGSWDPLHIFDEAASAVSGVDDFFHWVAWLFSPRNILRIVEFLAGCGLIAVGLAFTRAGSTTVGAAAAATPWGREAKAAKAALTGRATRTRGRAQGGAAGRTRTKTRTVFVTDPDDPLARRERLRRASARANPSNDIPF